MFVSGFVLTDEVSIVDRMDTFVLELSAFESRFGAVLLPVLLLASLVADAEIKFLKGS